MVPMEKRRKLFAAFIVVLMPVLSSCGDESNQNNFYSVNVINTTSASITVKYDWDIIWVVSDWLGNVTIPAGNSKVIEWSSANEIGEQIEVEYSGKTKLYYVLPVDTVTVLAQDF
jgi:hypothetical protein